MNEFNFQSKICVEAECPLSGWFDIIEADSAAEFYALLEEDDWEFIEFIGETGDEEAEGFWVKVNEVDWDDLFDAGEAIWVDE